MTFSGHYGSYMMSILPMIWNFFQMQEKTRQLRVYIHAFYLSTNSNCNVTGIILYHIEL